MVSWNKIYTLLENKRKGDLGRVGLNHCLSEIYESKYIFPLFRLSEVNFYLVLVDYCRWLYVENKNKLVVGCKEGKTHYKLRSSQTGWFYLNHMMIRKVICMILHKCCVTSKKFCTTMH